MSLRTLDPAEVDAPFFERLQFFDRIVGSNHADDAHLRQEARRRSKERGRATEHVVGFAEWSLDGVERHRPYNEDTHNYIRSGAVTPRICIPLRRTICAPRASARRARVTSSLCSRTWCL